MECVGLHVAVLGEVSNEYVGIGPDDERMRPYWALSKSSTSRWPFTWGRDHPGAAYLIPTYRARLSSPFLLEEVLIRHPMLGAYPQLHVDLGGIQWFDSRPYFYEQLRQLIDAGFGKRVIQAC